MLRRKLTAWHLHGFRLYEYQCPHFGFICCEMNQSAANGIEDTAGGTSPALPFIIRIEDTAEFPLPFMYVARGGASMAGATAKSNSAINK